MMPSTLPDSPGRPTSDKVTALRSKRDAIMKRRFSKSPMSSERRAVTTETGESARIENTQCISTSPSAGAATTARKIIIPEAPLASNDKLSPVSLRHHFNAARINRRKAQLRPGAAPNPSPSSSPLSPPTTYASDSETMSQTASIGRFSRYSGRSLTPPPTKTQYARPPTPPSRRRDVPAALPLPSLHRHRSLTPPLPTKKDSSKSKEQSPNLLSGLGNSFARRRYMRQRHSSKTTTTTHETNAASDDDAQGLLNASDSLMETRSLDVPTLESVAMELPLLQHDNEAAGAASEHPLVTATSSNDTESSNASKDSKAYRKRLFRKANKAKTLATASKNTSLLATEDKDEIRPIPASDDFGHRLLADEANAPFPVASRVDDAAVAMTTKCPSNLSDDLFAADQEGAMDDAVSQVGSAFDFRSVHDEESDNPRGEMHDAGSATNQEGSTDDLLTQAGSASDFRSVRDEPFNTPHGEMHDDLSATNQEGAMDDVLSQAGSAFDFHSVHDEPFVNPYGEMQKGEIHAADGLPFASPSGQASIGGSSAFDFRSVLDDAGYAPETQSTTETLAAFDFHESTQLHEQYIQASDSSRVAFKGDTSQVGGAEAADSMVFDAHSLGNDNHQAEDIARGDRNSEIQQSADRAARSDHPQDDEDENVAESTSFDFRSIHDLPEFAVDVAVDPSWNAHKVYFSEFESPRASSFVEEVAHAVHETRIDAWPLGNADDIATEEEKKDKESFDGNSFDPRTIAYDEELDPLGWPRLPEGLRASPVADPFATDVHREDDLDADNLFGNMPRSDTGLSDDDAEDLIGNIPRSEAGLTDILGAYTCSKDFTLHKQQRVVEYSLTAPDETSIDGQSDSEDGHDEDSSQEESVDVAYEAANAEEDIFAPAESWQSATGTLTTAIVDVYPTLEVAHASAIESERKPACPEDSMQLQATSIAGLTDEAPKPDVPEVFLDNLRSETPLLPPPPPPSSPKNTKTRAKPKRERTTIPLIAPPSAEKLKKWENRTKPIALGLSAKERLAMNTETSGTIPQLPLPTPCPSDSAVMMLSNGFEFGTGRAMDEKACERIDGPSSASHIMHDAEFAERIDVAISAAASKFEALDITNSRETPSMGAFVSLESESGEGIESTNLPDRGSAYSLPLPETQRLRAVVQSNLGKRAPRQSLQRVWQYPESKPSPFELAMEERPSMVSNILSYLGDPVIVCRMKMVCKMTKDFVDKHEQRLVRDAVRLGGLNRSVRPSFWLWITLEKNSLDNSLPVACARELERSKDLIELERMGNGEGRWHSVIERDVARSFGNLPPHKSGARLRTDSIVRALVTWGKSRIVKIGVKGAGDPPPITESASAEQDDELTPTDTVSDWGGVASAGSFASTVSELGDKHLGRIRKKFEQPADMALGNALTDEMKQSLQKKLSFILHALAAVHSDVGYCQGEDYVVAHLLRILQDTIRWKASLGALPRCVVSAERHITRGPISTEQVKAIYSSIDGGLVVEETCFRVMNTLFTSYGLRHFYWPELRCLKTSCLVFERLIHAKLPVLADHFEHHELNIGLFALGWFQTMFLYLPSMPSATVCHMWDIWLVERSFKIFFRVGCAILFLSQPILLNQELEGMMCYLNTFPDATLLSPDILIPCALQIKVTNRMLMAIEEEVVSRSSAVR